ncbi:hypothetical protein L1987_51261 [Smallanthus sonchifolius]|uniref:Uncharacterized protein n=1 Tax=Smallanthus sonchifolius TaxID=185202 RepID=A0ACB9EQ56_9ASTR|nr:hypothetical protein L1987_51261 [Smallanthus sonchifolius]
MPEYLYFNAKSPKYVNQYTGPIIDNGTTLENIYRLNMGGGQISVEDDTGMYRSWDKDDYYITEEYIDAIGFTPVYYWDNNSIMYTIETPNYTAPEAVYQTQSSMGKEGFFLQSDLVVFRIFINNQTAEEKADLFYWTQGSGYPVFKDYIGVSTDSLLPSVRCVRFSLGEVKATTHEFDDNLVIGNSGFVLCARPVIIQSWPKQEVNLSEWGKFCHQKGILHNIIDPELRVMIAPECLRHFGVVAVSCLNDQGSDRPAMEKVVWDLEFALKLQEAAEKTVG